MNILITGASRGIGLAAAKRLCTKGHNVGLFDIDVPELGQALKDKAFKKAIKSDCILHGHLDVTNPEDWDSAIEQMQDSFGGIDVLINNAGILITGELPDTDLSKQLMLVDINCKGILIGTHKVAQIMNADSSDKKNSCKIINLSSASAIYGQPELAPYSASKFFVRGLTEGLNIEFAARGIKVVDVMPLWVKTDMTQGVDVTSINRLGMHLTADDVAKTLFKLAVAPNRKVTKVHYPVGLPAKVFEGLAQVTPASITRWMNEKIGA